MYVGFGESVACKEAMIVAGRNPAIVKKLKSRYLEEGLCHVTTEEELKRGF